MKKLFLKGNPKKREESEFRRQICVHLQPGFRPAGRLRHAEGPLVAALRIRQEDLHRRRRVVAAGRVL